MFCFVRCSTPRRVLLTACANQPPHASVSVLVDTGSVCARTDTRPAQPLGRRTPRKNKKTKTPHANKIHHAMQTVKHGKIRSRTIRVLRVLFNPMALMLNIGEQATQLPWAELRPYNGTHFHLDIFQVAATLFPQE